MVQQPSIPLALPPQFQDRVAEFPTPGEPTLTSELSEPAAVLTAPEQPVRLRTRVLHDVAVVEVWGRLGEVAQDLSLAIQLALASGPRGVVCDLSAVVIEAGAAGINGGGSDAVEVLAAAGRHSRDWPGIPVALACPDPAVREAVHAHPLGVHLLVTQSLFAAVSAVLATPTLDVEWLHLAPHPTSARAAREFVTRTLLDWRLGRAIPFATLVVSELVASSSVNVGTEIDLSVAWNLGALRLTVRDHGRGLPGDGPPAVDLRGRARTVVAGLSRAFGVLPTADGGKVVWAVLEAPRPRPAARRTRSASTASQNSPVFTDGQGMAELPFCAAASTEPTQELPRPSKAKTATSPV
jgi:hypothetical protein